MASTTTGHSTSSARSCRCWSATAAARSSTCSRCSRSPARRRWPGTRRPRPPPTRSPRRCGRCCASKDITVHGVYPAGIDTDMLAGIDAPKTPPAGGRRRPARGPRGRRRRTSSPTPTRSAMAGTWWSDPRRSSAPSAGRERRGRQARARCLQHRAARRNSSWAGETGIRMAPDPMHGERARRSLNGARLAAGAVFVIFGLGKFLNHAGELSSFETYGIPWPEVMVYVVGVLEVVGGLALLAGVAVAPVALLMAGNMAIAIVVSGIGEGRGRAEPHTGARAPDRHGLAAVDGNALAKLPSRGLNQRGERTLLSRSTSRDMRPRGRRAAGRRSPRAAVAHRHPRPPAPASPHV